MTLIPPMPVSHRFLFCNVTVSGSVLAAHGSPAPPRPRLRSFSLDFSALHNPGVSRPRMGVPHCAPTWLSVQLLTCLLRGRGGLHDAALAVSRRLGCLRKDERFSESSNTSKAIFVSAQVRIYFTLHPPSFHAFLHFIFCDPASVSFSARVYNSNTFASVHALSLSCVMRRYVMCMDRRLGVEWQ
jgi:hypothetical protein